MSRNQCWLVSLRSQKLNFSFLWPVIFTSGLGPHKLSNSSNCHSCQSWCQILGSLKPKRKSTKTDKLMFYVKLKLIFVEDSCIRLHILYLGQQKKESSYIGWPLTFNITPSVYSDHVAAELYSFLTFGNLIYFQSKFWTQLLCPGSMW